VSTRGLADIWAVGSNPPDLRRGFPHLQYPAQPSAGAALVHPIGNSMWERLLAIAFVFTPSAAAGERWPVLNYCDDAGNIFAQVPFGGPVAASQAVTCYASQISALPPVTGSSVTADGAVTGPAAGAPIASVSLTQGQWLVQWRTALGGTTAAAEQDNFGLYLGAALQETSENGSASGTDIQQDPVTVDVPAGGATLVVNAIGAGTGTAVYRAQIEASPDGYISAYAALPDLTLMSGWQIQATALGLAAGDQIGPAYVLVERYPSNYASGELEEDERRMLREVWEQVTGRA
jgi:hypothetical protein